MHKLCHYPTIALRALLLLGYCHCNIFCSLIILYYNVILILLYFGICGAPNSLLQPIHITFVTPITIFDYVGAPKPPILHQHICYICIYVIELCMLMPANHILHHILVKFASLHSYNLTKFLFLNPARIKICNINILIFFVIYTR